MPDQLEFSPKIVQKTPIGILSEDPIDSLEYTIWELVDIHNLPVNIIPTVVVVDDQPVMREHWGDLISGKDVTFVTIPQGKFLSQVLQVLASIALTIVAGPLAGFVAGALGITSQIGLALIQAGIIIAGSFLIQALFKPDSPDKGQNQSPTYNIAAQGNSIRLFQPIPKIYGRHILWMDFAAQPWAEYDSNYQFLHQLFVAGLGNVEIESIRIEDTEIWNELTGYNDEFDGIEIEIVPPGNTVTLFPAEVVTSDEVSNLDLRMWGANLTPSGSNKLTHPAALIYTLPGDKIVIKSGGNAGIYTIVDIDPDQKAFTVTPNLGSGESIPADYVPQSPYGAELYTDSAFLGPFVINPSSTIINKIQFDITAPKGIFATTDTGAVVTISSTFQAQVRKIDTFGEPLGNWETVLNETISAANTTPQRRTYAVDVEDGRYEARVRRVDAESYAATWTHSLQWGAVRGFIPDDNTFPYVTLIAIKIRATGQLTQISSRKFNAIVRNKTMMYNGTVWSGPTYNKAIAWAVYDILTNTTYGAGVPASSIDLPTLYALHLIWEARGDYFNGVLDTTMSAWDAIVAILRAGRAIPVMVGGKISFKRFQAQTIPRGVFNTHNIVRNSFQTEHMLFTPETPDDIIIEFVDERTWKSNEVQCTPEDSISETPERINLFGVTDRSQAWREGIFLAEYNKRARLAASFTTELEGRILTRGDIIVVAHDLFNWGDQGVIVDYNATNNLLTLADAIDISDDSYILLRNRKNNGWGPVKVNPTDDLSIVQLDATDLAAVETNQGPIDDVLDDYETPFVLCSSETEFKQFTVVSGKPKQGSDHVDLVCMIDDPVVHTVDLAPPPPEQYPYGLTSDNRATIATLLVTRQVGSPDSAPVLNISWSAADKAVDYYIVQVSYDNITWIDIYQGIGLSTTYTIYPGNIWVRVAGFTYIVGIWTAFSGTFGPVSNLPLDPSNIQIVYPYLGASIIVTWDDAIRATTYIFQIFVESIPGSGTYDDEVYNIEVSNETIRLNSSDIEDLGGPWLSFEVHITSKNSYGVSTTITEIGEASADVEVSGLNLLELYTGGNTQIQWSGYPGFTSHTVEIEVSSTVVRSLTVNGFYYLYSQASNTADGGPHETFTVRVTPISPNITGNPVELEVNAVPGALSGISGNINDFDELEVDYTTANTPFITHVDVFVNTSGTFDVGDLIESNVASSNTPYSAVVIGDSGTLTTGDNYVWFRARNNTYNGYLQGPLVINKP